MDRNRCLELVRFLTRQTLGLLRPEQLAGFEEEFAAWSLTAAWPPQVGEPQEPYWASPQLLDTTLVAGMFLQVLLQAQNLPAGGAERVSYVRKEVKQFLVTRFAGQISLSQFFRLLHLIDENVQDYFDHLEADWPSRKAETPAAARPATDEHLQELRQALDRLSLPEKRGSRFTSQALWEFLRATDGRWFQLPEVEAFFRVKKKTAWGYLHLLLEAGILQHNGAKANRVRYALAPPYQAPPRRPVEPAPAPPPPTKKV
jgi:hypothetical protein